MFLIQVRDAAKRLFERHLFLTNITVSGTLFGLGDALQQNIEIHVQKNKKPFDWARTGRMAATGMFVMGPLSHHWFRFLDRMWPLRNGITIAKKVAMDQLGSGPAFQFAFFWSMGTLERKKWKEITHEFKSKFAYVFAADCMVWVPLQSLNFYFVQPQHRILFISCVFVLWNTILSYFKHSDLPVQAAREIKAIQRSASTHALPML
ncbi:mpv17-like protein 2 [Paramacrobiotus metropolitanus]|uniref:mpv17-like protein 2 n=1 Tax=Paramacrobiotus metropolitanus TaxID=2943436 RepID=UPI0024461CDD|nr:mpv17-like protein 2 [Paramacrobiotus metropolitanus]